MNVIKGGLLLLGVVFITAGITWYLVPERVVYSTQEQQKRIDSLSVELRNSVVTREVLRDSLQTTTDAFRERLMRKNEEIASYSRIAGELRVERDSLAEAQSVSLVDVLRDPPPAPPYPRHKLHVGDKEGGMFRDTTLVSVAVFGDSLIEATASGGIRSDSLFVEPPEIRMLRPVRLDVAVTVTDNREAVHTLVTSRDLENIRVEAYTEIKPRRRFPWGLVGLGTGIVLGMVVE